MAENAQNHFDCILPMFKNKRHPSPVTHVRQRVSQTNKQQCQSMLQEEGGHSFSVYPQSVNFDLIPLPSE